MHLVVALFILNAARVVRADDLNCAARFLRATDSLGDYVGRGVFSFALVERIRAVHAAGPRGSADRRADLDRAAADLAQLDRALNDIPGGDDAPWNSVGAGRADYAIYRGLLGNVELITIRRMRDQFRWEIEIGEDASGARWLVTTGLAGSVADAREALRMTAHRFPRARGT